MDRYRGREVVRDVDVQVKRERQVGRKRYRCIGKEREVCSKRWIVRDRQVKRAVGSKSENIGEIGVP